MFHINDHQCKCREHSLLYRYCMLNNNWTTILSIDCLRKICHRVHRPIWFFRLDQNHTNTRLYTLVRVYSREPTGSARWKRGIEREKKMIKVSKPAACCSRAPIARGTTYTIYMVWSFPRDGYRHGLIILSTCIYRIFSVDDHFSSSSSMVTQVTFHFVFCFQCTFPLIFLENLKWY